MITVYPRWCGVCVAPGIDHRLREGLPPLVRGLLFGNSLTLDMCRSTPAGAGLARVQVGPTQRAVGLPPLNGVCLMTVPGSATYPGPPPQGERHQRDGAPEWGRPYDKAPG